MDRATTRRGRQGSTQGTDKWMQPWLKHGEPNGPTSEPSVVGAKVTVPKLPTTGHDAKVLAHPLVDLRRQHLELREPLADLVDAFRRGNQRKEQNFLLGDPLAQHDLHRPGGGVARGQDGVHHQHVPLGNVLGQLLVDHVLAVVTVPLDEDLADLDALAACPQRRFHGFPATHDADPAYVFAELHPQVVLTRRRLDHLLRERQVSEPSLHHEPIEPVGVEDEVMLGRGLVSDVGVHASDLIIGRDDDEVGVDPPQVVLSELGPYVLHDEIDGHDVVTPGPWDDDVRVFLGGQHEHVKHGFHELGVLGDDPSHVPSALRGVPLDPPGQSHVVVGVHEDFHVEHLTHFLVV
eukprot:scaffold1724_cov341-Pavlova_lutheri.AAC.56